MPAGISAGGHGKRSALAELDELASSPSSSGFVIVEGARAVVEALGRHIERRGRGNSRAVVFLGGMPSDDAWRELSERLAVARSTDPIAAAETILERAGSGIVVLVEGKPTHWGRAVADELARLGAERDSEANQSAPLLIALREVEPDTNRLALPSIAPKHTPVGVRVIAADSSISAEDARLWWDAVARDSGRNVASGLDRLDDLEAWWNTARATPSSERRAAPAISHAASRMLARLWIARRSFTMADALAFGPPSSAEELIGAGILTIDAHGRLALAGIALPPIDPDRDDHLAVAGALAAVPDPWALVRAAELFATAGDLARAETSLTRAVNAVTDAAARADLWQRWEAALAESSPDESMPRFLRAADLALRLGDVDRAVTFAKAVASRRADSFDAMLMLGRATVARGDLTSAGFILNRALELAADASSRARAAAEIAEARYTAGDLEAARRFGNDSVAGGCDLETKLAARNVLGKLLLAESRWNEAEHHFAADACDAACSGDVTAELRARLNRAIAFRSSGRYDEARAMLTEILEEAEQRGELRAVSYALNNLATIATIKHDYVGALQLSERALEIRRRLGERIAIARLIVTVAELRFGIGLITEAEHALAFGRNTCGAGIPGAQVTFFCLIAARIHLARGNTLGASAEVASALAAASSSTDGKKVGECHRLAARIALEDGDVARAERAITSAEVASMSAAGRADLALLRARAARASGRPYRDAAMEALTASREADQSELVREAQVLLHFAAAQAGDLEAARGHLMQAIALRDRVSDALPSHLRERFLKHPDLAELARLERAAIETPSDPAPPPATQSFRSPSSLPPSADFEFEPPPRPSRAPAAAPRKIVGRDPAVLALLGAIQKVGASDATVLIQGESGTGKELVAEAVHEASARKNGPMVKVNCAALVETLLLSELFGHEKGSFTGAAARRRGRFELAEGGTLFLDEIGDISPRTQVALLRVLQERTFERVGGVTPIRANVRIICATHRDLKAMVARGEFREDLYYRLRGVVLEVPALRNRIGDLGVIAQAILSRNAIERGLTTVHRLSPAAIDGLSKHTWPGNVRELENALRAASLFAEGESLDLEDFTRNVDGLRGLVPPPAAPSSPVVSAVTTGSATDASGSFDQGMSPASAADMTRLLSKIEPGAMDGTSATEVAYAAIRAGVSLSDMKRQIERECIARALTESGGNITRAAGLLGMKRPRLSQLVKQYGFLSDGDPAEPGREEVGRVFDTEMDSEEN